MNSSMQVKPIDDLASHATGIEAIPALLELMLLGNCEIERGEFRSADEVFAELDQENTR